MISSRSFLSSMARIQNINIQHILTTNDNTVSGKTELKSRVILRSFVTIHTSETRELNVFIFSCWCQHAPGVTADDKEALQGINLKYISQIWIIFSTFNSPGLLQPEPSESCESWTRDLSSQSLLQLVSSPRNRCFTIHWLWRQVHLVIPCSCEPCSCSKNISSFPV